MGLTIGFVDQIQQRDDRWVLVDITGKGNARPSADRLQQRLFGRSQTE